MSALARINEIVAELTALDAHTQRIGSELGAITVRTAELNLELAHIRAGEDSAATPATENVIPFSSNTRR